MAENKKCSTSSGDIGNTISISPSKHWCFTLNNHTKNDIEELQTTKCSIVPILGFQEEVGESETPHLQGYLCFAKKHRPKEIFKNQRIHWEKCRNVDASIEYIQKEESKKPGGISYLRGIEPIFQGPKIELKPWQQEIVKILDQDPDDRKIYWYWEAEGCSGKTKFAQWLFHNKQKVISLSGKGADMKHGIVMYKEKNKTLPRIVIINIPRNNKNFVSYTGLEEIKDMFFFSGKYESGMVSGASPHLIVFSNSPPDYHKMSLDRWVVHQIS